MRREDRAKIFAPFAALSGHSDNTKERERITVAKPELTEDRIAEINEKLQTIAELLYKGNKVNATVTYFKSDAKRNGEGSYKTISGYVSKIDIYDHILVINGLKMSFDSIYDIQ